MVKDYTEGGVRMVDISAFDKALKLSWIKRISSTTDKWGIIANKYIDYKTIISTGGYASKDKIKKTANPFWKEILNNWNELLKKQEYPQKIDEILNQPLWYNKNMRDKELFDTYWFDKNIRYIRDITKRTGEFKSFQEIKLEYDVGGNFLTYGKLLAGIPKNWKDKLKTEILDVGDENINPIESFIKNSKGKSSKIFYEILTKKKATPPSE